MDNNRKDPINMDYYGYIYLVKDLVTNMPYIGQHKAKQFDPKYKPSGKLIRQAMKKYGFNRFKIKVITWAYSKEELNELERAWIADADCIWPKGYNYAPGGEGGKVCAIHPMLGKHLSIETRNKQSKAHKGQKAWNKDMHLSEEHKKKISIGNLKNPNRSMLGKHHTEYSKNKTRKALLGHIVSEDTRQKIRQGNLGKNSHTKWIYNTKLNEEKHIKQEHTQQYLDTGWEYGRLNSGGSK